MSLLRIQNFIQDAIKAIGKVLNLEVTVIDNEGRRIAGTGCFEQKIGELIPKEWKLFAIMESGEPTFCDNSGAWKKCRSCLLNHACSGTTIAAVPILVDGKIEGLISLVGFYEDQKVKLALIHEEAINYLIYIAKLIASKLSEMDMLNRLEESSTRLSTVLDNLTEGVIAINRLGIITNFNRGAERITHLQREKVLGKQIAEVSGIPWETFLANSAEYNNRSMALRFGQQMIECFVTVNLISHNESQNFEGIITLKDSREVHQLVQNLTMENSISFKQIIGESESFMRVKQQCMRVAQNTSTILLTGESGTGKEMFCRSIHEASFFAGGPFVVVNCAAIPETLLESELFGYDEGAFSGSKKGGKPGKFELANGGTLFLDEIGDMPLFLQAKILRVLESKTIERIGGIVPHHLSGLRLIFATNKNLKQMVENGQFREDLYYRISVVPIHLPPLRERRQDVPLLMDYFLSKYAREMHSPVVGFAKDTTEMLIHYNWPGNIREMRNVIEYAVNMENSDLVSVASLPQTFRDGYAQQEQRHEGVQKNLHDAERDVILELLALYGNTTEGKKRAAQKLGISLSSLYRKLK